MPDTVCPCYLFLITNCPKTQQPNPIYFSQFLKEGQQPGVDSAGGLWLRVPHRLPLRSAQGLQSLRGPLGRDRVPGSLPGCWQASCARWLPAGAISLWPHGPRHRAAHNVAAGPPHSQRGRARKRVPETEATVFPEPHLGSDIPPPLLLSFH